MDNTTNRKPLLPKMTRTRRQRTLLAVLVSVVVWNESIVNSSAFVAPPPTLTRDGNTPRRFVEQLDSPKLSQSISDGQTQASRPVMGGEKQARFPRKRHSGKPNNNNRNGSSKNNVLWKQKQLNRRLVQSESADELFKTLQQSPGALTKRAGGGVLNTVNFSTAIHRLARHSTQPDARTPILADPRLALLLAGVAEALAGEENLRFNAREVSNISWAIAKLRIAPPSSAMPLQISVSADELLSTGKDLRVKVVAASKASKPGEALKPVWVPSLSRLAGLIMDGIAGKVDEWQTLNQQEMSNMLWAWATADRADPAVYSNVIRRMIAQVPEQRYPQEWSNAIWAFGTARIYDGYEDMINFLADHMEDAAFVDRYKPQEISNTLWGCATLLSNMEGEISEDVAQSVLRMIRLFIPRINERVHNFKTQELANSLWAIGTLGFGLAPSSEAAANNYVCLPSTSPEIDKELKYQVIESIVGESQGRLYQFRSQELNNMAYGLARLMDGDGPEVGGFLQGVGREMCNPKRWLTSQDIASTIWSFCTLEFYDDNLYRGLLSRFTRDMIYSCKPQELSNAVWAIATAEIDVGRERDAFDTTFLPPDVRPVPRDPISKFFGEASTQLIRRPHEFKPQELKDILWSFSKAGIRHPDLFRSTAEYLVGREEDGFAQARGLSDFSPQALGNLAWSYARQAQLAEEVAERYKSKCAMSFTSGRLAVKTASCLDIGEGLIHRLFSEIAETDLRVHDGLSALRPQDVTNTVWTFGALAIFHDDFLDACCKQLMKRMKLYLSGREDSMTYIKGQEMSNALWALATLNVSPGNLLELVGAYCRKISQDDNGKLSARGIASVWKRQELANIAWSCAVFGEYPADLMTFLYAGLLGDKKNPDALAKIYADGGLQGPAVMTLLYVQAALDLSGSTGGLTLPSDFPGDWQQSSNVAHGDVVAPTFELALSTSKIQRDVSNAFSRIGFEHVEEHVITMEDLAEEYEVNLVPLPVEVLSIDIADVSQRIAIEVDGPAHFVSSITDLGGPTGYSKFVNGKWEYCFNWNGDTNRINGPTALKARLLSALGWKVIHLPFWEWSALDGEEAENEYCRNHVRLR